MDPPGSVVHSSISAAASSAQDASKSAIVIVWSVPPDELPASVWVKSNKTKANGVETQETNTEKVGAQEPGNGENEIREASSREIQPKQPDDDPTQPAFEEPIPPLDLGPSEATEEDYSIEKALDWRPLPFGFQAHIVATGNRMRFSEAPLTEEQLEKAKAERAKNLKAAKDKLRSMNRSLNRKLSKWKNASENY